MVLRRHSALHLLWTVPLATVLSAGPLYWGTLAVCGVSGCGGGGFGPSYGPNHQWVIAFVVVGLLYAAAVIAVPWGRFGIRLLTGLAVGTVIAGYLIAHAWTMKYSP
ncbi:MAG: hypothetical protein PGN30_05295 [Mycolicibacterium neoaurum]|uniref:hypothetical protein n=1 Tax=Mycolicibacterium neoaurum TaxID=1795 RepID=UPI002FF4F1E6